MKTLGDMETYLAVEGDYEGYRSNIDKSVKYGKQDHFDQVRYAMNIAHHANNNASADKIMFVGGIGVLGNLVRQFGTEIISQWRGTRDLDLLLHSPHYKHLISGSFDVLDYQGNSSSIKNKLCFRGYSSDAEDNRLGAAAVDAYTPEKGDPKIGTRIGHADINGDWEERRYANFFGVDVKVLNPMTLLRTKLSVQNSRGLPRTQDLDDIVHLLGLLEREGNTPTDIFLSLGKKKAEYLVKSISAVYETTEFDDIFYRAIVSNTNKFRRSLGDLI